MPPWHACTFRVPYHVDIYQVSPRSLGDAFDVRSYLTRELDNASFVTPSDLTTTRSSSMTSPSEFEAARLCFAFDDDLASSRVHRLASQDGSNRSLSSSTKRTQTWSIFSGLFFADISIISVIPLPM